MKLPTLTDDGRIYRHPELFRSAIEFTLRYWTKDLYDSCEDWELLRGAGLVAAEVSASGLDWEPFRNSLQAAACERGMSKGLAADLIAKAWSCAPHHRVSWIEMTREWVRLNSTGSIAHLWSGVTVGYDEFTSIFGDAFDTEDCELVLDFGACLLEIARIERNIDGPTAFRWLTASLFWSCLKTSADLAKKRGRFSNEEHLRD